MAQGDYEAMFKGPKKVVEARKANVVYEAFGSHVLELGRHKDVGIDFVRGVARLSIPNYFATAAKFTKTKFQNPVNTVALSILPDLSYHSGYGDSTEVKTNYQRHREVTEAGRLSFPAAIRADKAAHWLVANALGLNDVPTLDKKTWAMEDVARGAAKELNDGIIRDLPDIADMVNTNGYKDFLDYLVDARAQLTQVVDDIFEAGPQKERIY